MSQPEGLCGCGQRTAIAIRNDSAIGLVKGRPRRFVKGHGFGRPFADRFWEKVDKTPGHGPWGDCWVFTGAGDGRYGFIRKDGRQIGAHVASFELHFGSVPDGHVVRHRCDYGLCIRPDHILSGTQAENIADRDSRGRTYRGQRRLAVRGELCATA